MAKTRKRKLIVDVDVEERGSVNEISLAPMVADAIPELIDKRLEDKDIPLVDDGIPENVGKEEAERALERWYERTGVRKYVHMEEGKTRSKRIQFEFAKYIHGYSWDVDERGVNPAIEALTFANISKGSFVNNIGNALRNINYFIEFYDDDMELMSSYFMAMYRIMRNNRDENGVEEQLTVTDFLAYLEGQFTTPTLLYKLQRMIDHNLDPSLVKDSAHSFDQSIQLTVDHLRAIMGVSTIIKLLIPIVSHYCNKHPKELELAGITEEAFYVQAFRRFIDIFNDAYNVNLLNKLTVTASSRIAKTINPERNMWKLQANAGSTPSTELVRLLRELLTNILEKTKFNQSAIIYIHVCVDRTIYTKLGSSVPKEFVEMEMAYDDSVNETQSRWERWTSHHTHHSELTRVRSNFIIESTIMQYGAVYSLDFSPGFEKEQDWRKTINEWAKANDYKSAKINRLMNTYDEFNFYRRNIPKPFDKVQVQLVMHWFSAITFNTSVHNAVTPSQYMMLIMIMKRYLRERGYVYLPLFISGQTSATPARHLNRSRVEKLMATDPNWPIVVERFKDSEMDWKRQMLFLGHIISNHVRLVEFDRQDELGMMTDPPDRIVVGEIARFFNEH